MKRAHLATTFANAFECYEAIARWLIEEAPEPWKEITVEFTIIEIDDVCRETIAYLPSGWFVRKSKGFVIYDTGFSNCFYSLAKLTSTPEKGLFKKCRYVLYSGGKYKVDFEY